MAKMRLLTFIVDIYISKLGSLFIIANLARLVI
jgi:hypothetical protein